MSGARAAARSVGTLLAAGSLCAMAVAGARKPAPLQDDAAAPIVTAAAPAPIVIDARARPHRFTLDFTLSEESRSSLRVELRPEDAAGSPVVRELTLRFDPFEGARWHWTVRPADVAADLQFDAAMRSATSTPLTQISEPKGLHYRLAFAFHGGGGLSVEFADGAPLLAAQFGATAPLRVTVAPGGGVTALAVTPVEPQGDAALAAALGATTAGLLPWMAPARTDAVPPPAASPLPNSAPPFSRGSLAAAAEAIAPPVAVRPLDPVTAAEGRIARFIVEPRDRVEIPVVVIEPKRRDPARPLVVVACAAPLGKAAPAALQHAAELAARGHAVVAFDLLDGGERRMNQSFDPIDLPELRLVGSSAPAVALEELRQVVAWAATLPAATPDPATPAAELHADADAVRALRGAPEAPRFVALADLSAATTRPSATLADVAVFGEEYLRARYDSDLYHRAVQLRETCSRSDATPLAQRVAAAVPPAAPPAALGNVLLAFDPASGRVEAVAPGATRVAPATPAAPIALVLSDFGPRAALQLARATAATAAERCLAAGGAAMTDGDAEVTLGAVAHWVGAALAHAAGGAPNGKVRLVAEGAWGLPALLAASAAPEQVASLTVLRAPPSFELLLRRPPDAVRAEPRFGVLSQGAPSIWYVPNVFAQFELEELALALRAAGVPLDWREPVDAMRRPLDRHGRQSMWPRVRHQERPPPDR